MTVVLETAMDFLRQHEDISRQLEMLQSGEMRSGSMSWGNLREDTTAADIVRLSEAKRSLVEQALAILTRQPPSDGGPSRPGPLVHAEENDAEV